MADEQPRSRLGRGLAALLADTSAQMPQGDGTERFTVRVESLRPNPRNPRHSFDPSDLDDLAASIREKGILQPILVRAVRNAPGTYEIIAGERRWRAAQQARVAEVPVVVVTADDREALELAIVENVQRADLNAIEEARGYERLGAEFGYAQADLAKVIGKSRSHVANTLRLLKLPKDVSGMVEAGQLTAGHARALLAFDDPAPVARRILEQGLNVRDVEHLAQRSAETHAPATSGEPTARSTKRSRETAAIAEELSRVLGLSVTLSHRGSGGELRIRFKTLEQLQALCGRFRP